MSYNKISGIYTILNMLNNKIYVGCSVDVKRRLLNHKKSLLNNNHKNKHLQSAFNKDGLNNFKFELLIECSIEILLSEENYWCNLLNAHNYKCGYNIRPTHPYGKIINTPEIRKKISDSNKGRKISEESILKRTLTRKIRFATYKKKVKKLKVSSNRKLTGIWHSNATKQKMRKPHFCKRLISIYNFNIEIQKFDKDMNLKEVFNNVDCIPKIYNKYKILENCNNERKTSQGFIWKYKEKQN